MLPAALDSYLFNNNIVLCVSFNRCVSYLKGDYEDINSRNRRYSWILPMLTFSFPGTLTFSQLLVVILTSSVSFFYLSSLGIRVRRFCEKPSSFWRSVLSTSYFYLCLFSGLFVRLLLSVISNELALLFFLVSGGSKTY